MKYDLICNNCGQPCGYEPHDAVFIHPFKRWEGDNGYWCTKERETSADGRSKIDFNLSKSGFYAISGFKRYNKEGEYFELDKNWNLLPSKHNYQLQQKYWIF